MKNKSGSIATEGRDNMRKVTYRVGADIGGTFTDIVFMNQAGEVLVRKVSSTPSDYTEGIISGIENLSSENDVYPESIEQVLHATTVVTNVILERKGAKTGLITTRGFRDVLEIRRLRLPHLYDMRWEKPPTLIPRYLRLEVRERISPKGDIIQRLDLEEVEAAIRKLLSYGVEAIAVCFVNSYVNPIHEHKVGELLREKYPHFYFTLSADLMPLMKEYERTSEAVINSYVMPVTKEYLSRLNGSLRTKGIRAPLLVMQSSGGMMVPELAVEKPIYVIECGPAAGVVGAAYFGRELGIDNLLTLDMGGTTAKASMVEGGEFTRSDEYEVGGGLSIQSHIITGGGYVLRVPSIDIAEVGAGGGSYLWLDVAKGFHVGPASAGAVPGPVCYDLGGDSPTVTDADVLLGYLNPSYLTGGELMLNFEKARQSVEDRIATPLDMDVIEAAYGGFALANSSMMRAIRAVSSRKGRDVRKFTLFAFGGAGPVHAVAIARELRIPRVIVPPCAGVFSSLGLLFADEEHYHMETFFHRLDRVRIEDLKKALEGAKDKVAALAHRGLSKGSKFTVNTYLDMRYVGQSTELPIFAPWEEIHADTMPLLQDRFHQEHQKSYLTSSSDEPIEVVKLRAVAKVASPDRRGSINLRQVLKPIGTRETREVYFGNPYGFVSTPVLKEEDTGNLIMEGPVIIECYDTTVVVPPDCSIRREESGMLIMDIKRGN
jgi:N-methylhydantoinase A